MNLPNLYNLAFGNKNPDTGEVDDKIITDNGDSQVNLNYEINV